MAILYDYIGKENITLADFHIDVRPVSVTLRCPHCGEVVNIPWSEVDEPDCWEDSWGFVDCPVCRKEIELGDYDYD